MKRGAIRTFATGATRDTNEGKLEYARFLDSRVIRAYCEYMHRHRLQSDGSLRDPDNWKKGITKDAYMDSLWRHVQDLWELHQHGQSVRHENGTPIKAREALCGILFNAMGYLFEELRPPRNAAKAG